MGKSRSRPNRDIVVIGASTGGLEALLNVVRGLPENLNAAIFVVVHTGGGGPGKLAEILNRAGALRAVEAADGMSLRHGRIYVAQPDNHLLVMNGTMAVERGPKENGFRPSVDPLFRTAAEKYGARVVGVILSGALDDGIIGLKAIKERGGLAIVQDPEEALAKGMPTSALQAVDVDHVLRSGEIGGAISGLVRTGSDRNSKPDRGSKTMKGHIPTAAAPKKIKGDKAAEEALPGPPSIYTCPDCGGSMWEIREGKALSYRCHVGHAYGPEALLFHQDGKLEDALWTAVRLMEENAAFRIRMAQRARSARLQAMAEQYEEQAALLKKRAAVIRELLRRNSIGELAAVEGEKPVNRSRKEGRRGSRRRGR